MQYGKLFYDNVPFNKIHWLIWLIKSVLKLNKNEHTLGKYFVVSSLCYHNKGNLA